MLLTAHIIPRQPNKAAFTYHQRSGSYREDIPAPTRAPHGGRINVPNRAAFMPHVFFFDRNYAMEGRERWHLRGAHTVMQMGAAVMRGRMIGDVKRRPIRRDVPQAYGSQIPEIEGVEGEAYYYVEGDY
jgi:hypothetical protein